MNPGKHMQLFRKPQQPKHKHITGLGASEISLPCPVPHGNMATLLGSEKQWQEV